MQVRTCWRPEGKVNAEQWQGVGIAFLVSPPCVCKIPRKGTSLTARIWGMYARKNWPDLVRHVVCSTWENAVKISAWSRAESNLCPLWACAPGENTLALYRQAAVEPLSHYLCVVGGCELRCHLFWFCECVSLTSKRLSCHISQTMDGKFIKICLSTQSQWPACGTWGSASLILCGLVSSVSDLCSLFSLWDPLCFVTANGRHVCCVWNFPAVSLPSVLTSPFTQLFQQHSLIT